MSLQRSLVKNLNRRRDPIEISSTIEFLHNLSIPANSWQDPTSIDIQWSQPIECQCWQDPARNWQEISSYAKT